MGLLAMRLLEIVDLGKRTSCCRVALSVTLVMKKLSMGGWMKLVPTDSITYEASNAN